MERFYFHPQGVGVLTSANMRQQLARLDPSTTRLKGTVRGYGLRFCLDPFLRVFTQGEALS